MWENKKLSETTEGTPQGGVISPLLANIALHGMENCIKKGNSSPYDGNLVYWSTRMGKNPLMPMRKAKLLKTQKGKCNWCELTFRYGDILEEDHIIPKSKGGNNYYKNLQLLHRHCHDEKTATDGSYESSFK